MLLHFIPAINPINTKGIRIKPLFKVSSVSICNMPSKAKCIREILIFIMSNVNI